MIFTYPDNPSYSPLEVGALWRLRFMDGYIKILRVYPEKGRLLVCRSDIGVFAEDGEPYEIGIGTLRSDYVPHM